MSVKSYILFVLPFFITLSLPAQEEAQNTLGREDINPKSQIAVSSPDYRVTAGDIYTLVYAAGNTPVTYRIAVDSSYRIRVSNLGVINAAEKTFRQLKTEVEAIVSNNYPLSGVQLTMTRPAHFRVFVNGEVQNASEISTWAMERLSSLTDHVTPYASIRNVTVKSLNGQVKTYDLFKASRTGDLTQNPYLRPDDTVTFNRIERMVSLTGQVERPGSYQLLHGENLRELIENYGSGFTPLADSSRIEIVRHINSNSVSGDKIVLEENEYEHNFQLEHFDAVTVQTIIQLRPVLFVEGAIGKINESAPTASNRFVEPFNKGEYYSSMVRRNSGWFSAVSDTKNAYIIRGKEQIAINLNSMLYDATYRSEVLVEENDTLVIPFRQYFVTVAGAVVKPGRYPYIPDREWDYYIALAGGFVPDRNLAESVIIVDIGGKRLKKMDTITPETIITARTNHALYFFNQYAPVITTLASIITTVISVTALINR